jgi:phosphoribosylformimino-5-aminoimidazole carboxamide ribotide isomerase
MNDFVIFPAIDLRNGKVVRLSQGDPKRQTTYGDNPEYWAERWKSEGAEWLHVVNLSAAFGEEYRSNLDALSAIISCGLKVEYGGGIRSKEDIKIAVELGVSRLFLGTAAIHHPTLVDWAVEKYGPKMIAGDIGVQDDIVMVKGWQEATGISVFEMGKHLVDHGIKWCVVTNVQRDGVGTGVDIQTAIDLQTATGMQVVASGGVSTNQDINKVRNSGLAGVIVGRALYDGKISLRKALLTGKGDGAAC